MLPGGAGDLTVDGGRALRLAAVVALVGGEIRAVTVTSRVTFRALAPARVEWYVGTGEPRGKAGGYAVQGLGMALVAGVSGSLSNVVGLPVAQTLRLLGR